MGINNNALIDGGYSYKPTAKPTPTKKPVAVDPVGEFGSQAQWDAMFPNNQQLFDALGQAGYSNWDNPEDAGALGAAWWQRYLAGQGVPNAPLAPNAPPATPKSNGNGSGTNTTAVKNALGEMLKQYNKNPYENLLNQLLINTQNAQHSGADALAQLKAELGAQQNPYANLKFDTPAAVVNPLAQYMGATGASTAQTDALTQYLGALSQNAAQADQERAKALGASWNNLQGQRLADAATSQASFNQALAQTLAQQQGNLEAQQQKYQNDLYQQMLSLAMKYGLQMPKVG